VKVQPTVGGESLESRVARLEEVTDKHLGFGEPYTLGSWDSGVHPGTTPTADNGNLENFRGSWVEMRFEDFNTPVTAYHNLNVPLVGAAGQQENVYWWEMGYFHDGTGASATSSLSIVWTNGDAFDENSVELRLFTGGARTVDSDHPVIATLYFTPADGKF